MTESQPRRCVLYARLSVSKEESVSIDRQLNACRQYATSRGWEVIGEFVDDGVSASLNRPENRKGWSALLLAGAFDAVVIWKVDRLARRVLDFLNVDAVLRARNAGLVAVEDPIDMTTAMGRAFATILAVFGEMEAEAIRSRVKAARAQLIKDRRWTGGGIPYGYVSAENPNGPGRVMAKDPARCEWLGQMVEMAMRGVGVNAITTWLTEQRAPVPGNRRCAENRVWNRQTVDGLLRNPILAGMTPHNPGRAKSAKRVDPFAVVRDEDGDPWVQESLAVITYEEFVELQHALAARDHPAARPYAERQKTSEFLSRVVTCDHCDVLMYRGTNQKRPVLCCPSCRQTISRVLFDPYLIRRLLADRGKEPLCGVTVEERWQYVGLNEAARREILLGQIESLRICRGLVGRRFDEERVLLRWGVSAPQAVPDFLSRPNREACPPVGSEETADAG